MINVQEIADYQLRELFTGKLLINKYDLSLKYNYELVVFWKAFIYDLIVEIYKKYGEFKVEVSMDDFDFSIKRYEKIIKQYDLSIDIRDYVEINDYIFFTEWKKQPYTGVKYLEDKILLIQFLGAQCNGSTAVFKTV